MRTFTKSLVTFLLLLVAGTISAQTLKVLEPNGERDWSKQTDGDYPYYFDNGWLPAGATKDVVNGALHIYNEEAQGQNYQLQLFILDWFNTTQGEDYVIRIWMKADGEGTADLVVGTWGGNASSKFSFEASEDFKMYQIAHTAGVTSTNNDEHILFQSGTFVGNIDIQKVQILQAGEDKPVLSEYGIYRSLITNSDMENDVDTCFWTKIWVDPIDEEGLSDSQKEAKRKEDKTGNYSPVLPSEIVEGAGVDDSRGVVVRTKDKVDNPWDNQFWFRFTEPVPAGTKYKVEFDYKADLEGPVPTQSHASKPGDYIHYEMFGDINFQSDWEHFEKEGTISSQQSPDATPFHSVAFNLNGTDDVTIDANTFYFDNINFSVYEPQIDAQCKGEGIQILFPYYTNMVRLVMKNAKGKKRLMMPTNCFKVTIDGDEAVIESVEADITGALLVFIQGRIEEESEVTIAFTNPEDEKYRLLHIDTDEGKAVENFELKGRYSDGLNILSYVYGLPSLMESDPEEGSFNLKGDINNFKLVFDKKIDCSKIEAKIGSEALTAEPSTGFAEEIILKRTGSNPLADGEYTLTVTKIFGEVSLDESEFASCEINFSVGAKVSEELVQAIADANIVKDENASERYAGEAYTALVNAITKYDSEKETYTAPSVIDAAVLDLAAKVKDMKAHKTLVDNYDSYVAKAKELVEQYQGTNYETIDLYVQMKALAEKYTDKLLTDDEALTAANDELKPVVDLCGEMFTSGVSECGNAGIKVLVDRIRQGINTLLSLGVEETDPLIVEAKGAITDDDEIAGKIKYAITEKVYNALANPDPENTIFENMGVTDELEEPVYGVDMTVFIKNPNIYALQAHNGYSVENVPGWSVPTNNGELNTIWRHDMRKIEGLAEDVAFTKYHQTTRIEQTIYGLPAGVYAINLNAVNWDEGDGANGFVYVKTSETPDVEEGELEDLDLNFAGTADIQFWGQYVGNHDNVISEIVVTDGQLTIGANFGSGAQYEFDFAKLYLTAPADGFNYAEALANLPTNIDANKTAKVRAIQLFDLNGRSISKSNKGISIIKKVMSDGTIKTEKVIK